MPYNFLPEQDKINSIGSKVKRWLKGWFYNLSVDGGFACAAFTTASHNYAAGTTAWTLSTDENKATVLTATNAGGAVNAIATPTAGKVFIIYNNSGYTITFKASGQAGVAVTNGTRVILQANAAATDFVAVSTSITTISGATIDGSIIGGSTPAAAHVTTLDASGAVTLNPTGSVAINPSTTLSIAPTGAMTVNPTAASTINNASLGQTTPLAADVTTLGYAALKSATHDYGAAHADWTLSAAEGRARVFTTTNASGGAANAILPSGFVGIFQVSNTSGQTVTWKYAASTGIANATGKKQILFADGVEVYSLKADY